MLIVSINIERHRKNPVPTPHRKILNSSFVINYSLIDLMHSEIDSSRL
jgi:hypothetical protein